MATTNCLMDPQRGSIVPWIDRSTWLSCIPDEVLLHIISYATQPSNFLFWNTCCRRTSIICRDSNLITIMKQRFTKNRLRLKISNGPEQMDIISYLPNQDIVCVRRYLHVSISINLKRAKIQKHHWLLSSYDFVKNEFTTYPYIETSNPPIEMEHDDCIFLFDSPNPKCAHCTCQMKNGKPHGILHHKFYIFEATFDNGIIQSYKDEYTDVKLNDKGKVDMIYKRGDTTIKIVDGIIISYHNNQMFPIFPTLHFDNGIIQSDNPQLVSYNEVVNHLIHWHHYFQCEFLDISYEIKLIDSDSFIGACMSDLENYVEYIK